MIPSELQMILGVIYGYYTQYTVLGPISKTAFDHTGADKLDIYIDLDDIMMRISNAISGNNINISNGADIAITSAIVNMCGHYRSFYRNTFGVDTMFFIISNPENKYREENMSPEYTHPQLTKEAAALKSEVINRLSGLVLYIPKVHLMLSQFDFNSTALGISKDCQNKNPRMVISKDPIVSILGAKGFWLLRPKKYRGGDRSIIVTPEESFMYYYHLMTKRPLPPELGSQVSNLLDIYMALVGAPSRGLKGIMHYSTAVDNLIKCINDPSNSFTNSKNLVDPDIFSLCSSIGITNTDITEKIISRFRILNSNLMSEMFIMSGVFSTFTTDLYDRELMFRLNETVFSEYPLDLNGL